MSNILIISSNSPTIESIYNFLIQKFKNLNFYAILISENSEKLSIKNSYYIKSNYPPSVELDLIINIINNISPLYIFTSSEIEIKSLSAMIAAKMNIGILSDISEIEFINNKIYFSKPYIKNLKAVLNSNTTPTVITLSCLKKSEKQFFEYEPVNINFKPRYNIEINKIRLQDNNLDIQTAKKVIGIGRGVKKDDIKLIKQLASNIGAAIGYTRPVREELAIEQQCQIGITGKSISPKLYIAIGISGKEYHMKGIINAEKIIAINTDPQSPIKYYSDYFICADYKKVIEKLLF
ncbi:MAG: electron transfer flavoprotein subunit alpha/FixB family protein [Elusimicrobiales bacterium]|nr:electron transfer flavoprotein subunit alpha/FixB family protein [Elusimicrobiales bacterium]